MVYLRVARSRMERTGGLWKDPIHELQRMQEKVQGANIRWKVQRRRQERSGGREDSWKERDQPASGEEAEEEVVGRTISCHLHVNLLSTILRVFGCK